MKKIKYDKKKLWIQASKTGFLVRCFMLSMDAYIVMGVWVIRPPAPQKFSTSSTSYLRSSHYNNCLWVYGLFKPWSLTHATCTCFKETVALFNVHLSCFVNFILCLTNKYMFKVNKLIFEFVNFVTVVAQSTAKTINSGKAIYFLTLMSCSINKILHVIHM